MEDARQTITAMTVKQSIEFWKGGTRVNNQRQTIGGRPGHLLFQGLKLLLLVGGIPIEIQTYLTNAHKTMRSFRTLIRIQHTLHLIKHRRPVVVHLFGMEANQRKAEVGIVFAHGQKPRQRGEVDAGHEHTADTRRTRSLSDGSSILIELFQVEVSMGIYNHRHCPLGCLLRQCGA